MRAKATHLIKHIERDRIEHTLHYNSKHRVGLLLRGHRRAALHHGRVGRSVSEGGGGERDLDVRVHAVVVVLLVGAEFEVVRELAEDSAASKRDRRRNAHCDELRGRVLLFVLDERLREEQK